MNRLVPAKVRVEVGHSGHQRGVFFVFIQKALRTRSDLAVPKVCR